MAHLFRFTIDLVVEEALSQRRAETIARQMSENLHVLGVEDEDEAITSVDKNAHGHLHDTADGDGCSHCMDEVRDFVNGDVVVERSQ